MSVDPRLIISNTLVGTRHLGRVVVAVACSYASCGMAGAEVRMPAIFGSHMVLQSGENTPVWGWAGAGETVAVSVGEMKANATAGPDGKWQVKFSGLTPSAVPVTVTVAGTNTLTFEDVMIGDVWVCSGQSNMALPLRRVVGRDSNNPKGLGQADFPQMRLFMLPKDGSLEPQADCKGRWARCTPDAAREFSAAGYFFGRDIHRAAGIPVGLINACRGSTNGEYWTSIEGLRAEPALAKYVDAYVAARADYARRREIWLLDKAKWQAATARWPETLKSWEAEAAKARAEGSPVPARPEPPGAAPGRPIGMDPWDDNVMAIPCVMFNGMIAPLIPVGIRGAIWYQGEGNADEADLYQKLFPALIRDWRKQWGRGDFPFYFVQLAGYGQPRDQPGESNWAALREAQLLTLKRVPNTGMAVAIDIGNANDIHPLAKEEVGRRLALAALANTYGRPIEFSGPLYERMEVKDGKIRLHFTHVGGGLVAKGGGRLKRFAVAGADQRFVWADAAIDGGCVVVGSPGVPEPVAVRYAWDINPEGCNLYNADGLPASPYRTDDWELQFMKQ